MFQFIDINSLKQIRSYVLCRACYWGEKFHVHNLNVWLLLNLEYCLGLIEHLYTWIMPLLQGKKIKLLNESNLFVCKPLATLQKRQECFQISAHVIFISEMLVAHHYSKVSSELEIKILGWVLSWDFTMLVAPRRPVLKLV